MTILRELRNRHNLSQQKLADKLGISRSTVAMWENGSSQPDNDTLVKLSDIFSVTTDYLLGKCDTGIVENSIQTDNFHSHKIPILGNVTADSTTYTAENIIGWAEISEEMTKDNEYFALVINENSMEPYIFKGDIIIVKRQSDIESGHIDIVTINNKPECKKIVKHENGISLVSYNSSYAPIFYTWDETEKNISILGEVVEIRRNLKK